MAKNTIKIKRFLKKIIAGSLKFLNPGTIKIKHPRTGRNFFLDAYLHKGYWFRGKKVEMKTIDLFEELINEGEIVIEVGAHIGFITQSFCQFVGWAGKVFAFEPGTNNLPYLKRNILSSEYQNIILVQKAISDKDSTAAFYMENYTGQNNSLLPDHIGPCSHRNITDKKRKFIAQVETITLDSFVRNEDILQVDFIKIDIEGAELMALSGMKELLRKFHPSIMIEVTANHKEIFDELLASGYALFNDNKKRLSMLNYSGNIFGIHQSNREKLRVFCA